MGQKRYTNIIIYNTFSIIIQELNTHIIMFTAHIKDLFTKKKKKKVCIYLKPTRTYGNMIQISPFAWEEEQQKY